MTDSSTAGRTVRFLGRPLAPERLFAIAGPCVIESEEMTLEVAGRLKETGTALGIEIVFKSSYRKD
ncbi:MAG: 3-deoxy-8-phosphooctulonate synthase, partial [Candidatus Eisenbacteria bacterium]|nr:3-deoxy-8-phosphooctulonate synthase [Candidatus Eisenbacteria bacterium]